MGGIAKGSGMIHPNMATMLGVVTCDADVDVELWRALFKRAAVKSFNQVNLTRRCSCCQGSGSGALCRSVGSTAVWRVQR